MIGDKTARKLMYEWHGGGWSPFYKAASSGLVESFDSLLKACDNVNGKNYNKLVEWVELQQTKAKIITTTDGKEYF